MHDVVGTCIVCSRQCFLPPSRDPAHWSATARRNSGLRVSEGELELTGLITAHLNTAGHVVVLHVNLEAVGHWEILWHGKLVDGMLHTRMGKEQRLVCLVVCRRCLNCSELYL